MESLEKLEKLQLPQGTARTILSVVEYEITHHGGEMATKSDLALLRSEFVAFKTEIRAEMAQLRAEMREEMHETLHQFKLDMIKWAVGLMFGQTAVLMTFCYFLVSHLKR